MSEADEARIFHRAREIQDDGERRRFLSKACAGQPTLHQRVSRLLDADAASGEFLQTHETNEVRRPSRPPVCDAPLPVGALVGRYEVLAFAGEGGFAHVYRARQTQPGSPVVALKMLRASMASDVARSRFDGERRLLSRLTHRGIVQVIDAGETDDGRPFFAMEFVDGVPITAFATERGLGVHARVELLREACAAIQHAHERGVIHRDLKPSNVLVFEEDGRPWVKVIDFGIAKSQQDHGSSGPRTVDGSVLGTAPYMSPERANGEATAADPRIDVHALGVLLYELLTGTTPVQAEAGRADVIAILRQVATSDPVPPSVRHAKRGASGNASETHAGATSIKAATWRDLDAMTLCAIERHPAERYRSVAAFNDDLGRFLAGRVVSVRPPTAMYRARKFARRNRGLIAASAGIIVVLAVGMVGTTTGWLRARANEKRLEEKVETLDRIVLSQTELLQALDPSQIGRSLREHIFAAVENDALRKGEAPRARRQRAAALEEGLGGASLTSTARDILNDLIFKPSRNAIATELSDEPEYRADRLHALAGILLTCGLIVDAHEVQQEALALRDAAGRDRKTTIASVQQMALISIARGTFDEAEAYLKRVLDWQERQLEPEDSRTVDTRLELGNLAWRQSRWDEAATRCRDARDAYRRLLGAKHSQTLKAVTQLGTIAESRGDLQAARKHYQEALIGFREMSGDQREQTFVVGVNLGRILVYLGETHDGLMHLRDGIRGLRELRGADYPRTLDATFVLASALTELGQASRAIKMMESVVAANRRIRGARHLRTLNGSIGLASALRRAGRFEEAARRAAETSATAQEVFGEDHFLVGLARMIEGRAYATLRRRDDALRTLESAVRILQRNYSDDHPHTKNARAALYAVKNGTFEERDPAPDLAR